MRWFIVAILAYVSILAETTVFRPGALAVALDEHWARPDVLLVLGVFLAMFLEPHEVFVAGWCFGLASDWISVTGRLGVQALLFAAALYVVAYIRGRASRPRVLAQFLVCLGAVFAVHWLWYMATRVLMGGSALVVRSAEEAALDGLYSAVLAPYLFWAFLRLRAPLDLPAGT